jgi:hypothetical protein
MHSSRLENTAWLGPQIRGGGGRASAAQSLCSTSKNTLEIRRYHYVFLPAIFCVEKIVILHFPTQEQGADQNITEEELLGVLQGIVSRKEEVEESGTSSSFFQHHQHSHKTS